MKSKGASIELLKILNCRKRVYCGDEVGRCWRFGKNPVLSTSTIFSGKNIHQADSTVRKQVKQELTLAEGG